MFMFWLYKHVGLGLRSQQELLIERKRLPMASTMTQLMRMGKMIDACLLGHSELKVCLN